MILQRAYFSLFLGFALTPLAGYVGATTMPSVMTVWLWSLLVSLSVMNFKLAAVLFFVPSLEGAKYAWPAMCVILPFTVCVQGRVRWWTPFVCLLVGAISGLFLVWLQERWDLALAATFTGAILGIIFGYAVWLFDRHTAAEETISAKMSEGRHWILAASLSILFAFAGSLYFTGQGPETGVSDCGRLNAKLKPEGDSTTGFSFKCIGARNDPAR